MPIIQLDVAQEEWTSEQEKSLITRITLVERRVIEQQNPESKGANDIMREQLEYLIDHIAEQGICGCSQCQRYLRTRSVLLEIFNEPASKVAPEIAKVA